MRYPFNGNFPVTQVFGVNSQDYAQFGMKGHNGIDFGLPTGTPVVAAESGIVNLLNDPPGFGTYIQIVGAHKTIYAHLRSYTVPDRAVVSEGQQIGFSDNTGNSSGPHLHFGVKPLIPNVNNGYFGAIDPQPLLNQGDDMYNGKTAQQWAKSAQDATNVAESRAKYLAQIAQAAGVNPDHPLEQKDADQVVANIDAKNKLIQTKATELKPGVYIVK